MTSKYNGVKCIRKSLDKVITQTISKLLLFFLCFFLIFYSVNITFDFLLVIWAVLLTALTITFFRKDNDYLFCIALIAELGASLAYFVYWIVAKREINLMLFQRLLCNPLRIAVVIYIGGMSIGFLCAIVNGKNAKEQRDNENSDKSKELYQERVCDYDKLVTFLNEDTITIIGIDSILNYCDYTNSRVYMHMIKKFSECQSDGNPFNMPSMVDFIDNTLSPLRYFEYCTCNLLDPSNLITAFAEGNIGDNLELLKNSISERKNMLCNDEHMHFLIEDYEIILSFLDKLEQLFHEEKSMAISYPRVETKYRGSFSRHHESVENYIKRIKSSEDKNTAYEDAKKEYNKGNLDPMEFKVITECYYK